MAICDVETVTVLSFSRIRDFHISPHIGLNEFRLPFSVATFSFQLVSVLLGSSKAGASRATRSGARGAAVLAPVLAAERRERARPCLLTSFLSLYSLYSLNSKYMARDKEETAKKAKKPAKVQQRLNVDVSIAKVPYTPSRQRVSVQSQ